LINIYVCEDFGPKIAEKWGIFVANPDESSGLIGTVVQ
jgi:hypothetical protein